MKPLLLLLTWLMLAKGSGAEPPAFSPVDQFFSPQPATVSTNSGTSTNGNAAPANALDDKHKLSPGDKISFQIIEDRDPTKSLMVTDSGELDVPNVGRLHATGKTC